MAKTISPEQLGAALQEELSLYHKDATERVNAAGRKAMKELVSLTKSTAPVGARGSFRNSITSKETDAGHGMKLFTWGAKPPDSRLTHLLVNGHATKDGGRVAGSPFLKNALDQVLPAYEESVEEALIP